MMVRASTDNYTRPRYQAKATEYAVEKLKYELRLTDPKKQEKKNTGLRARKQTNGNGDALPQNTPAEMCVHTHIYNQLYYRVPREGKPLNHHY